MTRQDKSMGEPKLTKAQRERLRQLQRPGYASVATGNPTVTDRSLAARGLVVFAEAWGRPGFYHTRITGAGREAVPADDYEYCEACGSLTHQGEAACIHCGKTKSRDPGAPPMTPDTKALRSWRTNVGLRLTAEVGEWLEARCERENRTLANYIETLILRERSFLSPELAGTNDHG